MKGKVPGAGISLLMLLRAWISEVGTGVPGPYEGARTSPEMVTAAGSMFGVLMDSAAGAVWLVAMLVMVRGLRRFGGGWWFGGRFSVWKGLVVDCRGWLGVDAGWVKRFTLFVGVWLGGASVGVWASNERG